MQFAKSGWVEVSGDLNIPFFLPSETFCLVYILFVRLQLMK